MSEAFQISNARADGEWHQLKSGEHSTVNVGCLDLVDADYFSSQEGKSDLVDPEVSRGAEARSEMIVRWL